MDAPARQSTGKPSAEYSDLSRHRHDSCWAHQPRILHGSTGGTASITPCLCDAFKERAGKRGLGIGLVIHRPRPPTRPMKCTLYFGVSTFFGASVLRSVLSENACRSFALHLAAVFAVEAFSAARQHSPTPRHLLLLPPPYLPLRPKAASSSSARLRLFDLVSDRRHPPPNQQLHKLYSGLATCTIPVGKANVQTAC